MCTRVTTPDISIMLDPGCALGPRKEGEIPHPIEYQKLHSITREIIDQARACDYIFISHYHHDHYKPRLTDELYIHTTPEISEMIFKDKKVLLKDGKRNINLSQKRRARSLKQSISKFVDEIIEIDFKRVIINDTVLDFSWPVYHGEKGSSLGFVIMIKIRYKKECFLYAPDIQGPVVKDTMKFLLDIPVDVLYVGGPPFYLKDKLARFPFDLAKKFIVKLHKNIP
ncbi:MAG: hypothetical protein ACTSXP_09275 [Promethearchaeota archaeon]